LIEIAHDRRRAVFARHGSELVPWAERMSVASNLTLAGITKVERYA
jgi:hypothetical protein